jgi:multiple antibiotic resistance protein
MNLSDIPTIFFTLFFVVDPLGLVPVFIAYLSGYERRERTRVILKSTAISIAVSVAFIVFGRHLLVFLGITTGSFLVAGGILLFLISIEMLFGMPSRVKMRNRCEEDPVTSQHGDISVFPLAIPMLCGPGNIAALLMFGSQAWGSPLRMAVIALLSTAVFLIAMAVMFASRRLESFMGETGISITQRLIGLILSAMSVQFIKNGLVEMGVLS